MSLPKSFVVACDELIRARRLPPCKHEWLAEIRSAIQKEICPDRIVVGGSFGKGTAVIGDWDVDMVIFVNDSDLPSRRTARLEQLRGCLAKLPGLHIRGVTGMCVKGRYKGFKFDALFGQNFLAGVDRATLSPEQARERQKTAVLNCSLQGRWDEPEKQFSTSSTELVVDFIKNQPEAVISAIVLTKIWAKQRLLLSSSSSLVDRVPSIGIELMCVHVSRGLQSDRICAAEIFAGVIDLLARLDLDLDYPLEIDFPDYVQPSNWAKRRPASSVPLRLYDPTNPLSDVMRRFGAWDGLVRVARRTAHFLRYERPSVAQVFFPEVAVPTGMVLPPVTTCAAGGLRWLSPVLPQGLLEMKVITRKPALPDAFNVVLRLLKKGWLAGILAPQSSGDVSTPASLIEKHHTLIRRMPALTGDLATQWRVQDCHDSWDSFDVVLEVSWTACYVFRLALSF